eukprot:gene44996-60956_t
MKAQLGFLFGAFKDRIEAEIGEQLDALLNAPHPNAKKPAADKKKAAADADADKPAPKAAAKPAAKGPAMTSTANEASAHSPAFDTLSTLLHTRYSCRAFLPEPLPRSTIEAILAAAQRTASWCNAQPWQLTIASGATLERLRSALSAHMATAAPAPDLSWPREYRGVYQERRRECGWGLYEALGI